MESSVKLNLDDDRWNSFSRELCRTVRRYLADPVHRKEFEEWHLQKYGKPYHWKKGSEVTTQ